LCACAVGVVSVLCHSYLEYVGCRVDGCGCEFLRGFFFSSGRRHTRCYRDWSSDVCSSDLEGCCTRLVHDMSEMWIKPSMPGSISTNAPNDVRLRTLPRMRVPTGYFCGSAIQGSSSVCFMPRDRKSTRLNSSHGSISYAVFC